MAEAGADDDACGAGAVEEGDGDCAVGWVRREGSGASGSNLTGALGLGVANCELIVVLTGTVSDAILKSVAGLSGAIGAAGIVCAASAGFDEAGGTGGVVKGGAVGRFGRVDGTTGRPVSACVSRGGLDDGTTGGCATATGVLSPDTCAA